MRDERPQFVGGKLLKEEVPEIAEVNIVDVCQCGVDEPLRPA